MRRWVALVMLVGGCHAYDEGLLDSTSAERPTKEKAPRPRRAADSGESDSGMAEPADRAGSRSDPPGGLDAAPHDAPEDADDDAGAAGSVGGAGSAGSEPAAGSGGSAGAPVAGAAGAAGGPPPPAACTDANGRVWNVNGHCYFPLTGASSWYVGRDRCRELGAQLVVITTAEEQAFVKTVVGSATRWLGLARFGAPAFSWIGGEAVSYENWEPGTPNVMGEAAAVMRNDTYLWFDAAVTQPHAPLCERQ